eukprot:snap_masked-scaffold_7-processed-gene-1.21-mRNA-1 protein AED:1.00 eAED:1.00 QI:0/-1/0/0/-1/1/1/0/83
MVKEKNCKKIFHGAREATLFAQDLRTEKDAAMKQSAKLILLIPRKICKKTAKKSSQSPKRSRGRPKKYGDEPPIQKPSPVSAF